MIQTECWEMGGYRDRHGYTRIRRGGDIPRLSHRVSYELAYGPIPTGMHVCHHCDNPSCVRPTHLYLGTAFDNLRDAGRKGRLGSGNRKKTHCDHGHPFTPENTYHWRTRRYCRECRKQIDRQRGSKR